MIDFKSFVKGKIVIKLTGPTPERFFNICFANKIDLYDIKYIDGTYYFAINPKEYYDLKPIIKKTGSKTRIVKKYGLVFYMFKYRKHNCFAAGILIAAFLIYLMTLFLWDIQMEGNYMITNDMIMEVLNNNAIHHGMFMKQIDCEEIEKKLRNEFDDITWVSVEATGSQITIYVKENDEDYVLKKSDEVCNIVSTCDGILDYIITRTGTPLKSVGDEVKEGDIIVSGIINVYDDYETIIDKKYVASDADILIRTEYEYDDSIKIRYKYKLFTGKVKKNYYINFFDFYICPVFGKKFEKYDIITTDHQIKLGSSLYLPIHYGVKENSEYIEQTADYTQTQANIILEENLNFFLNGLSEKGVQIVGKDVKMGKSLNKYTYTGKIDMIAPAYEKVYDIGDLDGNN